MLWVLPSNLWQYRLFWRCSEQTLAFLSHTQRRRKIKVYNIETRRQCYNLFSASYDAGQSNIECLFLNIFFRLMWWLGVRPKHLWVKEVMLLAWQILGYPVRKLDREKHSSLLCRIESDERNKVLWDWWTWMVAGSVIVVLHFSYKTTLNFLQLFFKKQIFRSIQSWSQF